MRSCDKFLHFHKANGHKTRATYHQAITCLEEFPPIKSHISLCMCHVTSHDKLKTLNLHYHNAYGHQTSKIYDIQEFPSIKSQDPLIMQSYEVTWEIKCQISTLRRPMGTKLDKVVIFTMHGFQNPVSSWGTNLRSFDKLKTICIYFCKT